MIIPKPEKIEINDGNFLLNDKTIIVVSDETKKIGEYLADELKPATGFPLSVQTCEPDKNQSSLINTYSK